MLTKYGTDNIVFLLCAAIILLLSGFLISSLFISIIFILLGIFLIVLTLVFFRDPKLEILKEYKSDDTIVLSPAFGKVMSIEKVYEPEYIKTDTIRICIFLSPIDVHVNYIPLSGTVDYLEYKPGKFLAAYKDFASKDNEQSVIGVKSNEYKILFKQIVGVLARRIVYDVKIGDQVKRGDKFGMMKFGSRMDVFLPINSEIYVQPGSKVKGVTTPLAKIKK